MYATRCLRRLARGVSGLTVTMARRRPVLGKNKKRRGCKPVVTPRETINQVGMGAVCQAGVAALRVSSPFSVTRGEFIVRAFGPATAAARALLVVHLRPFRHERWLHVASVQLAPSHLSLHKSLFELY